MTDLLPPLSADDLDKARQALGLPPAHPGDGAALPHITTQEANAARVAALEAEVARLRAQFKQLLSEALTLQHAHGVLRTGVEGLRREHLRDAWVDDYAVCPATYGESCLCGADAHNARIDALLRGEG